MPGALPAGGLGDATHAQTQSPDATPQTGTSRLPYRPHRNWPLRPGRSPDWRRKPEHDVHEVLTITHELAFWALEHRDSS
jgi:hypothetical protein